MVIWCRATISRACCRHLSFVALGHRQEAMLPGCPRCWRDIHSGLGDDGRADRFLIRAAAWLLVWSRATACFCAYGQGGAILATMIDPVHLTRFYLFLSSWASRVAAIAGNDAGLAGFDNPR